MTPNPDSAKFPTLNYELPLWEAGYTQIAGIDEAGRGAWAGPVCAAALILPPDPTLLRTLDRVRDSKLMTPLARETWAPRIRLAAAAWGVGFASAAEIDVLGILPATKLAATRALASLTSSPLPPSPGLSFFPPSASSSSPSPLPSSSPLPYLPLSSLLPPAPDPFSPDPSLFSTLYSLPLDFLLTDFLIFPELECDQTALIKGDRLSLSVAGASVLAKTARDALMRQADRLYPGYGFARHKGYGTSQHQSSIHQLGLCEIHRKSFSLPSKQQ